MSEVFEKPVEAEVKDIEEVVAPVKEKKVRKSHLTEERKAELKQIRIDALKRGREAKKLKREAEALAKAEAKDSKKQQAEPLLPISESVEEKPKKQKSEKKPTAYKSINNSEMELLKKDNKIKELEYQNQTNLIKQEIITWKNENRLLKEQLEKLKKEQPVHSEEAEESEEVRKPHSKKKVVIVEPEKEEPLTRKEKKKFVTRNSFKY